MKHWLQFLFLLITVSALAHAPEPRFISRLDDLNGNLVQAGSKLQVLLQPAPGGSRSTGSADFQVCRIARPPLQHCGGWTGFQTRRAHDVVPAADWEIGDTAGWETCATLEADAGGSPREINAGARYRLTPGHRDPLQLLDTATLSHGENITYLLAANQTLAASYRYDPYGNQTYSSGSLAAANVYRFSSKEVHLNSGLYTYGYRFYSPNWQRWLNQDPLGESGGINLYQYVYNSPLNYVDPLGQDVYKVHLPADIKFNPGGSLVDHRMIVGDDGKGGIYVLSFDQKKDSGIHIPIIDGSFVGRGHIDVSKRSNISAKDFIKEQKGCKIKKTVATSERIDKMLSEMAAQSEERDPFYVLLLNDCGTIVNQFIKEAEKAVEREDAREWWEDMFYMGY